MFFTFVIITTEGKIYSNYNNIDDDDTKQQQSCQYLSISCLYHDGESSLSSCSKCRLSTKRLLTLRPSQRTLAVSLPVGCRHLHLPSPFIIIAQPKVWYSFYHPKEDRRLSPLWLLATYREGLPIGRWSSILVWATPDILRIAFKQSVLVYKRLHGFAPAYLTDELCQVADVEARQ